MKRRKLLPVLYFVILLILSFIFDKVIIKYIEGHRSFTLDYFFLGFSLASNILIIFFFLTTLFLWKENKKRWIVPLWLSALFSFLISLLIKIIIHRKRPFETGDVSVLGILFYFMRNSFNKWDFSFPSMHAVIIFAALPILDKEFKKFKYIWLVFATFAAFSRVYLGAHYLSDVIAGALIGYLIGYIMVLIEEKYEIGKRLIGL